MTTPGEIDTEDEGPARAPPNLEHALVRALAWPVALFVILATLLLFLIGDLRFDIVNAVSVRHIEAELVVLVVAVVGVGGTTLQLRAALRKARELQRDLRSTREDAQRWRAEKEAMLRKFGTAVEHRLADWGLTSAEKEIALLVLRGLSYKEVASVRGTAERTVRHQALAIYRKAGVAGRAEMAAVFLKDMLEAAGNAAPEPGSPSEEPAPPPSSVVS
jgi:DNA-binding CsgD family transcriptional regulator